MKVIKGFKDILPNSSNSSYSSFEWEKIIKQLKKTMYSYNYTEILTPVLEYASTFKTGIGEDTDIVSKEMYEFVLKKDLNKDSGSETYCLRPEGTAPIVRSLIENSLHKTKNINKLFYVGPMFRYERMQKGRYRMFHQIGAELIGSNEIHYEVELLILAKSILDCLEINEYKFQINSIGNQKSLENISKAVKDFGDKNRDSLDEIDLKILQKNPLRFLDKAIHKYNFKNSPKTIDYLDKDSLNRFNLLTKILDSIGFKYTINNQMVRGIDYYNDFVFEVNSPNLGAQDAILAGGRYDSLVQKFGGPSVNCVGFAAGLERLVMLVDKENNNLNLIESIDIYIVYEEPSLKLESLKLATKLRSQGLRVEVDLDSRSYNKQTKAAEKSSAKVILSIQLADFENSIATLKNTSTKIEERINLHQDLDSFVKSIKVEQNEKK